METFSENNENTEVAPTVETPSSTKTEAIQKDKWGPLQVPGLPEGTCITTPEEPTKSKIMENFRRIIESEKWDMNIIEDEDGSLSLKLDPIIIEGIEKIGNEEYLDTSIARKNDNGEIELLPNSGYNRYKTEDYSKKEGLLHRGLSFEEMQDIIKTKTVKSRGDVVKNSLTFFSKNPNESLGYSINGQVPAGLGMPTFQYPAYHITIDDPGVYDHESYEEVGILESIGTEKLKQILEIRPYLIKSGTIPLKRHPDGRLTPVSDYLSLYKNPVKVEVALKEFYGERIELETK